MAQTPEQLEQAAAGLRKHIRHYEAVIRGEPAPEAYYGADDPAHNLRVHREQLREVEAKLEALREPGEPGGREESDAGGDPVDPVDAAVDDRGPARSAAAAIEARRRRPIPVLMPGHVGFAPRRVENRFIDQPRWSGGRHGVMLQYGGADLVVHNLQACGFADYALFGGDYKGTTDHLYAVGPDQILGPGEPFDGRHDDGDDQESSWRLYGNHQYVLDGASVGVLPHKAVGRFAAGRGKWVINHTFVNDVQDPGRSLLGFWPHSNRRDARPSERIIGGGSLHCTFEGGGIYVGPNTYDLLLMHNTFRGVPADTPLLELEGPLRHAQESKRDGHRPPTGIVTTIPRDRWRCSGWGTFDPDRHVTYVEPAETPEVPETA